MKLATLSATEINLAVDRATGALWGPFIADALAMPAHWYYNLSALRRDYGRVEDFVAPKNPHPDSILWRSRHIPAGPEAEILHDQAKYWGQRDVHYHQFLRPGENTLNLQLAHLLIESLEECGSYESDDYLERYIEFMQTPGSHRDTYVEEYHREFFNKLARGGKPHKCGVNDIHIGGLAHVPVLVAWHFEDRRRAREVVQEHVQLTHRSRDVLRAADTMSRILFDVIAGYDLRESIVLQGSDWFSVRKWERWLKEPDAIVIGKRLSPACYIKDAFPAALFLAWKYANDFETGLIANTNVGGDNCHRGVVVGALLGAARGKTNLPVHWQEKLLCAQRLHRFRLPGMLKFA